MSETRLTASTSLLPPVSEQPSLSLKTSHGFVRRSTNLWLPLSPFPVHNGEEQEEVEDNQQSYEPQINPSPHTPSPFLGSGPEPERIEINDQAIKSIFEDWEDPLIPSSAIYIEKDGAQTLLITPQSAFFYPPAAPRPFGYEPFSKGFAEQELVVPPNLNLQRDDDDDSEIYGPILLTPKSLEHHAHPSTPKQPRGILFVDTNNTHNTYPTFAEWSATIFCSPKLADLHSNNTNNNEAASWAPKGFAYGPDVPMDCIYSAGDVSPVERWDEKLWSPILRNGLRTAPPCV